MSEIKNQLNPLIERNDAKNILIFLQSLSAARLSFEDKMFCAEIASRYGNEALAAAIFSGSSEPKDSMKMTKPQVANILAENLFFFHLPPTDLIEVVTQGSLFQLRKNQHSEKTNKGFSLIVSGKVVVKRGSSSGETEIVLDDSYAFGELDQSLGFGECKDVTALEDSIIFHIPSDKFEWLLCKFPSLRTHISDLTRSAQVAKIIDNGPVHIDLSRSDQFVRRGARISLKDKPTFIDIDSFGVFPIKDISKAGLYVSAFAQAPIQTELTLTVSALHISFKGTVVRKEAHGSGFAIEFFDEKSKQIWLKFVSHISLQTEYKKLQEQLFPLPKPLPITFAKDKKLSKAKLIALNELMFLMSGQEELKEGDQVFVEFDLPLSKMKVPLKTTAIVESKTIQGYKMVMPQLSTSIRENIEIYLSEIIAQSDVAEDVAADESLSQILQTNLDFTSDKEFSDYYADFISQNSLVLDKKILIEPKQRIRVRIKVLLSSQKKIEHFEVVGVCVRKLENGRALVAIDALDALSYRRIKKIIEHINFKPENETPLQLKVLFWCVPALAVMAALFQLFSTKLISSDEAICRRETSIWMKRLLPVENTMKKWEILAPSCISEKMFQVLPNSKLASYYRPLQSFPIVRRMVEDNKVSVPVTSEFKKNSQIMLCSRGKPSVLGKVQALDLWKDVTQVHFESSVTGQFFTEGDTLVVVDQETFTVNTQSTIEAAMGSDAVIHINLDFKNNDTCQWKRSFELSANATQNLGGDWKWYQGEFDFFVWILPTPIK